MRCKNAGLSAKGQSRKLTRNAILHAVKLFLYIEIGPWKESAFEKPLVNFASGITSDLIGAELDNQSDNSIADLVIRLFDQAQSAMVVVVAKPDQPLGATLKLFHHLIKSEQKLYRVLLSGSHEQAEKLLRTVGNRYATVPDQEEIKAEIKRFALA